MRYKNWHSESFNYDYFPVDPVDGMPFSDGVQGVAVRN